MLAAGGIADPRGFAVGLGRGACGAWLGTRFIATPEAYGHDAFKQRVIDGRFQGAAVTFSCSGKRMRAFCRRMAAQAEEILSGFSNRAG
ncbi:nitronate monooxygenase [Arthrobacter sp. ISL-85]|uniref:nitronate monooxygenase n=1 Tax=Arthrobacter sp. ISL-85 TaxID=2819115 RepID=UPI001BE86BFB|nr:nitronate monooxygenase [Arthrobacter sp. ISL-85]